MTNEIVALLVLLFVVLPLSLVATRVLEYLIDNPIYLKSLKDDE